MVKAALVNTLAISRASELGNVGEAKRGIVKPKRRISDMTHMLISVSK